MIPPPAALEPLGRGRYNVFVNPTDLADLRLWDDGSDGPRARAANLSGPFRHREIARLMRGAPLGRIVPVLPWAEVAENYEEKIRPTLGPYQQLWDGLVGAYRRHIQRQAEHSPDPRG